MSPDVAGHEDDDKETEQDRDPDRGYLQRMDWVIIMREDVDVGEGMMCCGGNRGRGLHISFPRKRKAFTVTAVIAAAWFKI